MIAESKTNKRLGESTQLCHQNFCKLHSLIGLVRHAKGRKERQRMSQQVAIALLWQPGGGHHNNTEHAPTTAACPLRPRCRRSQVAASCAGDSSSVGHVQLDLRQICAKLCDYGGGMPKIKKSVSRNYQIFQAM